MSKYDQKFIDDCLHAADNERSNITNNEAELFGLSSRRLRCLLNNLVAKPNTTYLELGVYKGATLLSAIANNVTAKAIGIDDFSYDEREPAKKAPEGKIWDNVKSHFEHNLVRYKDPNSGVKVENITFKQKSMKDVVWSVVKNVDVCFYDLSGVLEENYKMFLDKVVPSLAPNAIIVFSNYSNETASAIIDKLLLTQTSFEITGRAFRIANGLSDSTKYYSGVLVISIQKIKA